MNPPRLIDGTLAVLWRHATSPLDRDSLAALTNVLPVAAPGLGGVAPVVAPGAYGHDALQDPARHAHILEPVDHAACASATSLARGRVVVHPHPMRLGDLLDTPEGVDTHGGGDHLDPWPTWEQRFVLDPDQDRDLAERVHLALRARPHRLRLEDPAGMLDLGLATELAHLPGAHRLTLAPTNVRGIATAIAHAVIAVPDGPAVVSTLLGRAPRGAPATEHLVDTPHLDPLRRAAETLALVTGRHIEPEHPHWGTDATPPNVHPRTRVDTLDTWVHDQLHNWGVTLTGTEHDHLMTTLRARIRPGDHLDGPTLWATLATVTDLPARATAGDHTR